MTGSEWKVERIKGKERSSSYLFTFTFSLTSPAWREMSSQFLIFSSKFLHTVLLERLQQQFFRTYRR